MCDKLILVKDNKKSEVYENNNYIVKISDIKGFFLKRNDSPYVDYDIDKDDGDYSFVEAVKLEIKNKSTGKKAQKRCFQGYGVIEDVQRDLNSNKNQFKSMFKKIDKE